MSLTYLSMKYSGAWLACETTQTSPAKREIESRSPIHSREISREVELLKFDGQKYLIQIINTHTGHSHDFNYLLYRKKINYIYIIYIITAKVERE